MGKSSCYQCAPCFVSFSTSSLCFVFSSFNIQHVVACCSVLYFIPVLNLTLPVGKLGLYVYTVCYYGVLKACHFLTSHFFTSVELLLPSTHTYSTTPPLLLGRFGQRRWVWPLALVQRRTMQVVAFSWSQFCHCFLSVPHTHTRWCSSGSLGLQGAADPADLFVRPISKCLSAHWQRPTDIL